MAQFDIHRYARPRGKVRYLLDLQSDLLQRLETRVVAPLYERKPGEQGIGGINPELELSDKKYFVSLAELAAVHRSELGERVGSLAARRHEIVAGIDLVFIGI